MKGQTQLDQNSDLDEITKLVFDRVVFTNPGDPLQEEGFLLGFEGVEVRDRFAAELAKFQEFRQREKQWEARVNALEKLAKGRQRDPKTDARVAAIKDWVLTKGHKIDEIAKHRPGRGYGFKQSCKAYMDTNHPSLFRMRGKFDHAWRVAVAEMLRGNFR